ncbi:unnamed protein product [Blepharisma stoltei]|uniref:Electron transfer flavoprotein subunit alpha n=1 Tax=Blepharisma stoltei TaxID=1481888 RepID=A0AAU9JHV5_9CILI|nr:unnamed protein product [Blepharisma stoltei]
MLKRAFSSLILAEHNNTKLAGGVYSAINAADYFNEETTVLVAGENCSSVAEEASKIKGVTKVLHYDNPVLKNHMADVMTQTLQAVQTQYRFKRIIGATSQFSRDIIPRLGGVMNTQPISDVVRIMNEKCFKRPGYAGNAIYTVTTHQDFILLTIRSTSFDRNPVSKTASPIERIDLNIPFRPVMTWVSQNLEANERPELGTAKIIVTGGRGLKSKDNWHVVEGLAEKLGAGVGASRAAVDAGFCSNDLQIGQTGKIVAPNLYIACGVSGAIQHIAGMKDSKVIVAINTDPEAPIFSVADYGLVADLFKAIPEIIQKL